MNACMLYMAQRIRCFCRWKRSTSVSMGDPLMVSPASFILKQSAGNARKSMKNNRTHLYFTLILLAHILVYLLKVDRDYFSIDKYYRQPHQAYTEQLLSKGASYFGNASLGVSKLLKPTNSDERHIDRSLIWRSITLSYNFHIQCLLKLHESAVVPTITIISIVHKITICHKSSEDEELKFRSVA